MNKDDQESNNELVETNKNLSAAMGKIEMRCKLLEEKNEKLKQYKKMFKNSSAQQCTHCSKFIANNIFLNHVNGCVQKNGGNTSVNLSTSAINSPFTNSTNGSTYNALPANFLNLDPNHLIISINQTMVRESPDNKPYTEYLIQLSYQNIKWEVARKYKNFCELHQQLQTTFRGLKFPESSLSIINSSTDINNVFYNKRPTVIEDRRKALQQYIRDLAKMDLVRNSKPYKNFLEIDKNIELKSINSQSNQQKTVMGHNNHHSTMSSNTDDLKNVISQFSDVNSNKQFQQQQQQYLPQQLISLNQQQQQQINYQQPQQQYSNTEFMYTPTQSLNSSSNQYKIDKKLMPQSPTSFLKSWNEKNLNKENNSRSSGSTHSQNFEMIGQYSQEMNNFNQQYQQVGQQQRQQVNPNTVKLDLYKKRNSQVYQRGENDQKLDNSSNYIQNKTIEYN